MAKEGTVETYYEDGKWKNKVGGNENASSTHETKKEAQPAGKKIAEDRGLEHVVKKVDGTIGEKNSYGNDPRNVKG